MELSNSIIVTSALAIVAFATTLWALINHFRNRRFQKREIEWNVGKENDQAINYEALLELCIRYEELGGKRDVFISFAVRGIGKRIRQCTTFEQMEGLFRGYHADYPIVRRINEGVSRENLALVRAITEDQWSKITEPSFKLSQEGLAEFRSKVRADWARDYELSEIFYERIQAKGKSFE